MAHWIDNADSYICSACGFECNNPNTLPYGDKICPECKAKMIVKTTIMDKPMPCPFCGAVAIIQAATTEMGRVSRFRVKCSRCWCQAEFNSSTPDEAVEKWNRRPEK